MVNMIIEFQPNKTLPSLPPQWWVDYKEEGELEFKRISLTYEVLKTFLETFGFETNDILELQKFGVDTHKIKHNRKL
jgi:hypothetical protein